MKDVITHIPTRTQNRLHRYTPVPPADVMKNEPDTDFDLAQNQEWVRNIFAKWKKSPADSPEIIPLQIGAETVVCEKRHKYMDRCQDDEVCVCEMSQADAGQVMKILEIAEKDPAGWRKTTLQERHKIMYEAANRLGEMRGDLIGCMCAVTGKTVVEGDVEVSEGIDYAAPAVKHIILTGGTDTAQNIARSNPATPLSAETGGKNAIILTASGDRDHAIMNIVASAFGNAGQKCSACSLLLVERSVYEDKNFQDKLKDAATSMKVGSVWNPGNVVGPMITNKNDKLLKALELEKGESWLVPPRFLDKHKYVLAPTVKWGVRPGNYSFRTELFGPMLSVVCIENLQQGIDLVNSLEYGLTSGLQSLDEGEQKLWKDSIMAGNLYINRGITGAIVNRQPFGGMKLSAFGGGVKAGGPNYCACFVNIADKPGSTTDYTQSYVKAYEQEFAHARDVNNLYGEQNAFRYLPLKNMVLRLFPGDNNEDAKMIALAARICHTPLSISFEPGDDRTAALASLGCPLKEEALAGFLKSMKNYERIRTCGADIPMEMYEEAARIDKYIATAKPVKDGRVELIHYIKEQSISFEYHRYGSILEVPPVE